MQHCLALAARTGTEAPPPPPRTHHRLLFVCCLHPRTYCHSSEKETACSLANSATHVEVAEVGDALQRDREGRRRGWVRGRRAVAHRGGAESSPESRRGRQQSSSTSRLPDPTSPLSETADSVAALMVQESLALEDSASRIQAAFRGFRCRRERQRETETREADERAAMYRDQIDTYIPEPSSPALPAVSPIRLPKPTDREPPPIELVECADGSIRPSMGLSFAFVTSAEKLGLMLEPQSPDASTRPTGELIVENRRRSSSLTNSPAMELDFSAVPAPFNCSLSLSLPP